MSTKRERRIRLTGGVVSAAFLAIALAGCSGLSHPEDFPADGQGGGDRDEQSAGRASRGLRPDVAPQCHEWPHQLQRERGRRSRAALHRARRDAVRAQRAGRQRRSRADQRNLRRVSWHAAHVRVRRVRRVRGRSGGGSAALRLCGFAVPPVCSLRGRQLTAAVSSSRPGRVHPEPPLGDGEGSRRAELDEAVRVARDRKIGGVPRAGSASESGSGAGALCGRRSSVIEKVSQTLTAMQPRPGLRRALSGHQPLRSTAWCPRLDSNQRPTD